MNLTHLDINTAKPKLSPTMKHHFKKCKTVFQEIMGTKPFGNLYVMGVQDFFQIATVMDSSIIKDVCVKYGPLAANLWAAQFHIKTIL